MNDVYTQQVNELAAQYNSMEFEQVHASWESHWPIAEHNVLDIGAGSGRDAKWFATRGCKVFALEPNDAMRDVGKRVTNGLPVTWLKDQLPSLNVIQQLGIRFDRILLSAVWMHIPQSDRERAFRKLSNLLAPNGRLVITLRHGEFNDGRKSYGVSAEQLDIFSQRYGLKLCEINDDDDHLRRSAVRWQTVIMSLPDDGSGDLLKIRHALVNDKKTATYKLALLRTLVRIADAHPGCITDKTDGKVALPMGLVALYWAKQYRKLLHFPLNNTTENEGNSAHLGIQQTSNIDKGLGFVKASWQALGNLNADDLSIGALFVGTQAKAVTGVLNDCCKTIKEMPVKHLWHKNKEQRLFEVERKAVKKTDAVLIDSSYLDSFGDFVLDESFWHSLKVFGSWIEPLIIQQWVAVMQNFKLNRERNLSFEQYQQSLQWIDLHHNTSVARQRADRMIDAGYQLQSVWSGKNIRKHYHMDHCLPFAHWPCNDLWNLLPSTSHENSAKRDRVPSQSLLNASRSRVTHWWSEAWAENAQAKQTFMIQSIMALPGLNNDTDHFDDVFEAMQLQVQGVKERLLVNEWNG